MTEAIKLAATMILIRNRKVGPGLEVYMTKRPDTMLFLPGYYVFPGGVMQKEDQDERLFAYCVQDHPGVGLAYAITAIRECFEEVGYLLADLPVKTDYDLTAYINQVRERLVSGQLAFRDWVIQENLRLRTDLLRYYGHRITPRTVSRKRFDTRYFLTIVPPETKLSPCPKEVDQGEWIIPHVALEKARQGIFKMVPPTMDALADLARFESAEAAFRCGSGVGTPRPHELA